MGPDAAYGDDDDVSELDDLKARAQTLSRLRRQCGKSPRRLPQAPVTNPISPSSVPRSQGYSKTTVDSAYLSPSKLSVLSASPSRLQAAASPESLKECSPTCVSQLHSPDATRTSNMSETRHAREKARLEAECRVQLLASQQLQQEVESLQQECAGLREQLLGEARRRAQAEQRLEIEAEALQTSFENSRDHNLEGWQHELRAAEATIVEKDKKLQAYKVLTQDLHAMVTELQQLLVDQARGFSKFILSVREHIAKDTRKKAAMNPEDEIASYQRSLQDICHLLLQAEKASGYHFGQSTKLQLALEEAKAQHGEHVENLRNKELERKQNRMLRHSEINEPNLLKEMAEVTEGVSASVVKNGGVLQRCQLRVREVQVSAEEDEQKEALQLSWFRGSDLEPEGSCQLDKIILIGYGFASRAPVLCPKAAPEDCFSVYTATKTFDFVCPGVHEVGAILTVLSRLCARVKGWPVAGSLSTRSKFLSARGWCKVQRTFLKCGGGAFCTYLLACLGRPHRHRPSPGGIFPLSAVGSPSPRSCSPSPRRHEKVKFGTESVRTFTPRDEEYFDHREESEEEEEDETERNDEAVDEVAGSPETPSASSFDDVASPAHRQLLSNAASTDEVPALAEEQPETPRSSDENSAQGSVGSSTSATKKRSFLSGMRSPTMGMGWLRSSKRTSKAESAPT
eukprot:TRINITY_DN30202_c0_g1_i1.p1 TRINITY_DN30202_c0_g1~~TRINITY_DN30202_c0_g1_i1.p1  ORF type:complete len:684 (+),score=121.59 TRINITY_DN30202_c0_g1_i1:83-2134(+)